MKMKAHEAFNMSDMKYLVMGPGNLQRAVFKESSARALADGKSGGEHVHVRGDALADIVIDTNRLLDILGIENPNDKESEVS